MSNSLQMFKSLARLLAFSLCALIAATSFAATPKSERKPPEVVMYTTQTCGYCVKARAWLKARNVAWQERDIEKSADAERDWKALGGVGTPLIVINGTPFTGFAEQVLSVELAKYGK